MGNLPSSLSGFSLKVLFAEFGEITDASIVSESSTGRSKRFGFVTFKSEISAKKARNKMHHKDCEGLILVVKIVDDEEQDSLTEFHHENLSVYA